jgi:hypothetical protein
VKTIPDEFDPRAVIGQNLELVTFASNTVYFRFGDVFSVAAFASFRYRLSRGDGETSETVPASSSAVMSLIGRTVTDATTDAAAGLAMSFEDGATLEFWPDESPYESYFVSSGGLEFAV